MNWDIIVGIAISVTISAIAQKILAIVDKTNSYISKFMKGVIL